MRRIDPDDIKFRPSIQQENMAEHSKQGEDAEPTQNRFTAECYNSLIFSDRAKTARILQIVSIATVHSPAYSVCPLRSYDNRVRVSLANKITVYCGGDRFDFASSRHIKLRPLIGNTRRCT